MKALFTSFQASNYTESKRFYESAIGLPVIPKYEEEPHRFTNYNLDGMSLKVYEWLDPYYGSGHSGLFIETEDLDDSVERIQKFGGKVTDIEVYKWGGRCSSITDPYGIIFSLIDSNQKGDA